MSKNHFQSIAGVFAAILLLVQSSPSTAANYSETLSAIKQGLLDAPLAGTSRTNALEALADTARAFVKANPERAEALVWEGIVLAELSAARRNMSSLSLAKKSRGNFEAAEKMDPGALDWSVYSLLAYLYANVPRWPIGFGDKERALELHRHALALNPASAEPHRYYGEFLIDEGKFTEAVGELDLALSAPLRAGDRDTGSGSVCNARQCMKYTEQTDGAFRAEVRAERAEALKRAKRIS